ncbi:MAG TPA: hypothetical protein VF405_12020 [Gammaproteobacteria bacterium]
MLAALLAELPPHEAAAQGTSCPAITDDAERLACYDRALRGTTPAPAAPSAATQAPAPAAQAPAAPATPAPAAPATQAPAAPTTQAQPAAAKRDADDEVVAIVVVGVRTLPGRETTFTAKDGVLWVQTDTQRIVGLPDTPFDADLKPGAMGSTFLVPKDGSHRAIRVRRVAR